MSERYAASGVHRNSVCNFCHFFDGHVSLCGQLRVHGGVPQHRWTFAELQAVVDCGIPASSKVVGAGLIGAKGASMPWRSRIAMEPNVGGCFVPAFLVSTRHDVFHA